MILTCPTCSAVNLIRPKLLTAEEDVQCEHVTCRRCKAVFQVTINLLHEGEKILWDPLKGELVRPEPLDSVDAQRCPHGKGSYRTCPICSNQVMKNSTATPVKSS